MAVDITNESDEEPVELTDNDLDVIDEVNREHEPDENEGGADEVSGTSDEVDEPRDAQDQGSDDSPDTDENLVQWANYYGINPDDYSSDDALRRHVESTAGYYQQQQQALAYQQQQYAQQQPTDTQEAQPAGRQFRVGLDDDYDEGLVTAIDGLAGDMNSHFTEQLEILAQAVLGQQQFISSQQEEAQSQEYRRELDSFDDSVGGLKNSKLFGDSSYENLEQGSSAAVNRERLYDQVLVLATGYQTHGQAVPEMGALVDQAYRTVFSDEVDNQSRRSFNSRVRKQAKTRLGSGSSAKKTSVPTDDPVDSPVLKEAFDGYLKDNGDL